MTEPLSAGVTLASSAASAGLDDYGYLLLAFVLSSLVGLERELRQRSAGLRTHTLVGLGAALIMLVSKFGFADVIAANHVVLDPSRIAAQIVSGIGFIGGGLIFVRRDAVRGLTTAATIWLVAAIGMACGAGLPLLALVATAGHFVVVFAYPPLTRALRRARNAATQLRVDYLDGRGVLRIVLVETTARGFIVEEVTTHRAAAVAASTTRTTATRDTADEDDPATAAQVVSMQLRVSGKGALAELAAALTEIDGVVAVSAGEIDPEEE